MNPLLVKEAASVLLSSTGRANLRSLLSMAAAGLLIFAGLGYYLDWYKVQRTVGPDGNQNIAIGVNTNEIRKDLGIVRDRAGQIFTGKPGTFQAPTQPTPGYPTSNPYPTAQQYPPQQYPNQQYPASQYPQQQYPQQQYPASQYPASQYPQYQTPGYPQQQQPGYYPQQQQPQGSGWTPAQPTNRPSGYVYPPANSRPF